MKKFDSYLQNLPNEKYKYFANKSTVYKADANNLCEETTKAISNIYFNIVEMELETVQAGKFIFRITLKWHGVLKEVCRYFLSVTENNLCWSEIQTVLRRYSTQYTAMFPRLCRNYILDCANDIIYEFNQKPVIGWMDDNGKKEFMGITQCDDAYDSKIQFPFAYDNSYTSYEKLKTEDANSFFVLLKKRSLLGIFAYTLHSILWFYDYYGKGTDTEYTDIFSICICGKDANHIKWVANLLSNILLVDSDHPFRIQTGSRLSCSAISTQNAICWRYRCIPLLITHKKDIIPKTAKIVKDCQQNRETGKVHFFPVYLSTRAMNADEIIDFSVGDIVINDNFPQLKLVCNTLLYNFIQCLSDSSATDSCDNGNFYASVNNIYDNMLAYYQKQDNIDYDTKKPELMLRIAIRAFCHYLREKTPYAEEANAMENNADAFFLAEAIESHPKIKNFDSNFAIYHFEAFIHYCLDKANNLSICFVAQEKSGEECYYLSYNTFYSHYTGYLKKNALPILPKLELFKLLKAKNLLIMRANGKQYGMDRVIPYNDSKSKQKVIIIKKNAFEALVEDKN